MFQETTLNTRNRKVQGLFKYLFLLMTVLLILPVVILLGMLIYKGGSVVTWEFVFPEPTDGPALELRHAALLIEMEDARAVLNGLWVFVVASFQLAGQPESASKDACYYNLGRPRCRTAGGQASLGASPG